MKTVPSPGSLSTLNLPPLASTRFLQTTSPSPIPFALVVKRGWKSFFMFSGEIPSGIRLGLGHPMGPFTLLDFVGLDTTLFIAEAVFAETKDARFAAPPLLRRMVSAGYLGKKSGRGFYTYDK